MHLLFVSLNLLQLANIYKCNLAQRQSLVHYYFQSLCFTKVKIHHRTGRSLVSGGRLTDYMVLRLCDYLVKLCCFLPVHDFAVDLGLGARGLQTFKQMI